MLAVTRVEGQTLRDGDSLGSQSAELLRLRNVDHAHRNQTLLLIVERFLDPEPDVLRRLRSPLLVLLRAAFLGIPEPQHEVDSVPCGSGVPGVLGNQLASDRCPDVGMAASLDLHRHIECGKADADVRPLVLGVDALRLRVDSQPSKPFLQIGQ